MENAWEQFTNFPLVYDFPKQLKRKLIAPLAFDKAN